MFTSTNVTHNSSYSSLHSLTYLLILIGSWDLQTKEKPIIRVQQQQQKSTPSVQTRTQNKGKTSILGTA